MIVDFRQFGVGSKVILHNTDGEATTQAVMRFDVVKRRRRGGARAEACSPRTRSCPPVNAQRALAADLPGARGRRRCGRSPAAASTRCGSTAARGWARPSCGRASNNSAAHASDAPARLPLPRRQRSTASRRIRATRAGRTPSRSTRNQTVVVRPYFDYFAGRLRVPLPRRRARRHVDDGPDGGRRVIRRALLAALLALALLAAAVGERRGARGRSRPSTRRRSRPSGRRRTFPRSPATRSSGTSTQPGNANAATHDIWLVAPGGADAAARRARYLGPEAASEVVDADRAPTSSTAPSTAA